MSQNAFTPGIVAGRLAPADYAGNFADLHPPLDPHEARVAAERCYFCHDAPCVAACPTAIDIPLFIRQIATGTPEAAARTIFDQNILGGMCARVCPTETLCEQACVREAAEGKPVLIGQLQRHATDTLMARGGHPFRRAAPTGRRIAVVGAGPAGLACAHRLAMHGHEVMLFDGRDKPGGLNEYGIAAYKAVGGFARAEVDWLLQIGGIEVRTGQRLGRDLALGALREEYDAVFLGIGLGGVNPLGLADEGMEGLRDAVDFIAELRQADDLAALPVGLNVTLVYRRGRERMNASPYEQDLAASKGVRIVTNARPVAIHGNGAVREVEFEYTDDDLRPTGQSFRLPADQVFKAIGQRLEGEGLPRLDGGRIAVTGAGRTSVARVWAGGDCAAGGDDLTVTAVAEGRDAAEDIHRALTG